MIFIDDKTGNPITEHKPDILDRLDQERVIGRGGTLSKKCTCDKKQLKGYTLNVCLSKL
jgi:hypothetical protein